MSFKTKSKGKALIVSLVKPVAYLSMSYGPASTPTMYLGWVFVALLVAIFVIIALLLVGAVLHKRPAEDPPFNRPRR